ncbi:transposase [Corallococcus exiguus]|uniref:transposase n=1 Tax=Corallococcus exiguus TaxID=83462 RepID=UPI00345A5D1C
MLSGTALSQSWAPGLALPRREDRDFFNAVVWRVKTGAQWRDLPDRFGNWKTVYNRFHRWA